MPSLVRVVVDGPTWDGLHASEELARLPQLLCFVERRAAAPTPRMLKALSLAVRERLAVVEVRVHAELGPHTAALAESLRVAPPAFVALGAPDSAPAGARLASARRFSGPITFRRLSEFAEAHALPPPSERADGPADGRAEPGSEGRAEPGSEAGEQRAPAGEAAERGDSRAESGAGAPGQSHDGPAGGKDEL